MHCDICVNDLNDDAQTLGYITKGGRDLTIRVCADCTVVTRPERPEATSVHHIILLDIAAQQAERLRRRHWFLNSVSPEVTLTTVQNRVGISARTETILYEREILRPVDEFDFARRGEDLTGLAGPNIREWTNWLGNLPLEAIEWEKITCVSRPPATWR